MGVITVLTLLLFSEHCWTAEPSTSIPREHEQETLEQRGARIAGDEPIHPSESRSLHEEEALKKAVHWMQAGKYHRAYLQLVHALRDAEHARKDTTNILLLLSQVLLRMGQFDGAVEALGVVASRRPSDARIQLDHAALLFTLGEDDSARIILLELRNRQSLSEVQRRNVEKTLERVRDRQHLKVEFDLGFWRDDNVNNAPEDETVPVPAFGGLRFTLDQRPKGAWVSRTGARLRWQEPISEDGRLYVETHASGARNTAIGASEYNRTWANLSTGPRLHYAAEIAGRRRPGLLLADLGIRRSWCGGKGCASGLWAGIGVEQSVDRKWRVGAIPRLWITQYDEGTNAANPVGHSFALFISRRIGPGWLKVSGAISREKPKDRLLRWTSHSASMQYSADIGTSWGLSAGAGLTWTAFDNEAPLFLARREDRTRNISLKVSHRWLAWEGYLPELTLNWSRTVSSIPLYDREARSLRLGIRRLF